MIEGRCWHSAVALENKLIMIGGAKTPPGEVYDERCDRFVSLNDAPQILSRHSRKIYFVSVRTFLVGSKVVVLSFGKLLRR